MNWSAIILLSCYCALIALASCFGGALPTLLRLTHRRMQILVSLVGGLMLGVSVLHLLPHSIEVMSDHVGHSNALSFSTGWLLAGLLTMFFMLRVFHFHHHEAAVPDDDHQHLCGHDHDHDHHDDCLGRHEHDHDSAGHHHIHHPSQGASWFGIFLGMAIHSLIDGGSLAAGLRAESQNGDIRIDSIPGFDVFLTVFLHKPLDALTITTVMSAGGWTKRGQQLTNIGFALICPLGAAIFYWGTSQLGGLAQSSVLAAALAFSAGVFLVISLSDLLPEVQFHSHDRWVLSFSLILGVLLAYGIGFLEHGHMHGQDRAKPAQQETSGEHDDHHDHPGHRH